MNYKRGFILSIMLFYMIMSVSGLDSVFYIAAVVNDTDNKLKPIGPYRYCNTASQCETHLNDVLTEYDATFTKWIFKDTVLNLESLGLVGKSCLCSLETTTCIKQEDLPTVTNYNRNNTCWAVALGYNDKILPYMSLYDSLNIDNTAASYKCLTPDQYHAACAVVFDNYINTNRYTTDFIMVYPTIDC